MTLRWLMLLLVLFSTRCAVSDLTTFYVRTSVLGVFKAPTGVTGTSAPRTMDFKITAITLVDDTGGREELLTTEQNVTINHQSQELHKAKISSAMITPTYSQAIVTFDASAKAVSRFGSHTLTLTTTQAVYNETFNLKKGRDMLLVVHVRWKNTVTRDTSAEKDTMEPPSFDVVVTI